MALKFFARKKTERRGSGHGEITTLRGTAYIPSEEYQPAPRTDPNPDPLLSELEQGRLNIVLRDEVKWINHPGGTETLKRIKQDLEEQMKLVPAGGVSIAQTLTAQTGDPEEDYDVDPFLLSVHPVTCERFQKFVDSGGYDALDYWPEEIWPHLIELKDMTGQPGPRFWRGGRHDVRLANHPVVGLSWYEAQAFSLWVGQRLPTEQEWQMAASWHIKSSTDIMRRFPWGDAMDNTRCNIWSSRRGETVPVTEYESGAAPNQVLQLVGNVWEWVDAEYVIADENGRQIIGEMPLNVVRGGAFDTYFEAQANSSFRTGQLAMARSHNTGFRCAMDIDEATWINDV